MLPAADRHPLYRRAFDLGVTVAQIARGTGYPRSRVSRVLNGRENSAPMTAKIADYLASVESRAGLGQAAAEAGA